MVNTDTNVNSTTRTSDAGFYKFPGVVPGAQFHGTAWESNRNNRVNIRFNADLFNALNHPNNPNTIGGDGLLNTRASGLRARAPQLGAASGMVTDRFGHVKPVLKL